MSCTGCKYNSKKGYDHIRAKIDDQELIDHITSESEHQPVQLMCRILKMPKSTYYQFFHKKPNSYHIVCAPGACFLNRNVIY